MPEHEASAAVVQRILAGRSFVLERIARGDPLPDVLESLTKASEAAIPEMFCSILILHEATRTLHHGAAPSLPAEYTEAVDGIHVGLGIGSCGTCAHLGERVIVEDVATHPYWKDYAAAAMKAGLRACWSAPIRSSKGALLGTFAMYYAEPRAPTELDLHFIHSTAHLAGVAIERAQVEAELEQHRHRLEALVAARTEELERTNAELRRALDEVSTLSGMLPICAGCKRVRDDRGYWEQIESYISRRSELTFSHGLCPPCVGRLYPDLDTSGIRALQEGAAGREEAGE